MKIYRGLDEYKKTNNPVVTAGTFDGVHLAHRKIINRIQEIAGDNNGNTVVLTYWPHPRFILSPQDSHLKLLNTLDEKIELLAKFKIDHLIIIPFTKEFSQITSREYIENILVKKIGVKKLVIGYNHHFGRNREGTLDYLKQHAKQYDFEAEEIPEQDINDIAISSTKIRNALENGEINIANTCLGYRFFIIAKVTKYVFQDEQKNLAIFCAEIEDKYKLIPGHGSYKIEVEISGKYYKGVLKIGAGSSSNCKNTGLEVQLFNFTKIENIKEIKIYFESQM